jgi:hypothetical protein
MPASLPLCSGILVARGNQKQRGNEQIPQRYTRRDIGSKYPALQVVDEETQENNHRSESHSQHEAQRDFYS